MTDPDEREAWRELDDAGPWLNKSHRGITQITAFLIARMRRGEAGVPALNLLRLCLGSMGLNPTSSQSIRTPPASEDPADKYFNWVNPTV